MNRLLLNQIKIYIHFNRQIILKLIGKLKLGFVDILIHKNNAEYCPK